MKSRRRKYFPLHPANRSDSHCPTHSCPLILPPTQPAVLGGDTVDLSKVDSVEQLWTILRQERANRAKAAARLRTAKVGIYPPHPDTPLTLTPFLIHSQIHSTEARETISSLVKQISQYKEVSQPTSATRSHPLSTQTHIPTSLGAGVREGGNPEGPATSRQGLGTCAEE